MPRQTISLTDKQPSLLFVEGKDEVNFFDAFLKHLQSDSIQTRETGGRPSFRQRVQDLT